MALLLLLSSFPYNKVINPMKHMTKVGHDPEHHWKVLCQLYSDFLPNEQRSLSVFVFAAVLTFSPLSSLAWRIWTSHCS